MDLIYAIFFFIVTFIKDIENVILTKDVINSFANEKVLSVSDGPSILQCAQRCRYIDKNAIIDFKDSTCTCVKYETEDGQEQKGTFTNVFVNHEIKKVKINGGLSNWKDDSVCTATCGGGGTLTQIKTCTNPVPQNGGADCIEKPKRMVECNMQACPCAKTVDGTCCKFPFFLNAKARYECTYFDKMRSKVCHNYQNHIRVCADQ